MAFTEFGVNAPQAVKRWSDQAFRETFGKMYLMPMIGRGPGACIQLLTDLDKNPGDTIKYDLLLQDRGDGVNGDSRLKGYEDDLQYEQDEVLINQKRKGTSFRGMSQQRTVHDLRRDGRFSLTEWASWFFEAGLFAHMAGVTGDGNESIAGALGGDTGQTDWAGNLIGVTAGDSSTTIDADHTVNTGLAMKLSDINDLVAKAKEVNPRVPPLRVGGQEKYVLFLHHFAEWSLKNEAGAEAWTQIQSRASARSASNPIYTGALGEYNGVILKPGEFIPRVGNETHNVMVGASAATIAFGNAYKKRARSAAGGGGYFEIREDDDDYGNEQGMALCSIPGFKRSQFDGKAFGCMTLVTTETGPS